MSWNEEDIELIDRYLRGTLNGLEHKVIVSRLSQDESLVQLLKEIKLLHKSTRLSKMEKVFQGLQETEVSLKETPNSQAVSRKLWPRVAAAASIILLLGLVWFLLNPGTPDTQKIFADAFEVYPNNVIKRSEQVKYSDLKNTAYSFYDQKKYAESIPQFLELYQTEDEKISLFYLAVASLADGQTDQTIQYFNEFSPYAKANGLDDQTAWYLALAYLKKGELDNASTILKELSNGSSPEASQAKALLKKL